MKLFFKILFLISMIFILTSCSSTDYLNYGDANQFSKIRHYKKPVCIDSSRGQFYVAGSYNTTGSGYYYNNETASFGEGSIHYAHSGKRISAAYGISAFSGKYKVVESEDNPGYKDFWGYALSTEISFGTTKRRRGTNLYYYTRPFGVRLGIFNEAGDFAKFRETDELTQNISLKGPYLFLNLFAEFEEMITENKTLGLRFAMGLCPNGFLFAVNAFYSWEYLLFGFQITSMGESKIYSFQVGYKIFDTQLFKKK